MRRIGRFIFVFYLFIIFVVLALLTILSISLNEELKNNARHDIAKTLISVRNTAYGAIVSSFNNHKASYTLANMPLVRESAIALVALPPQQLLLQQSSSQQVLRNWFTKLQLTTGYEDYFIIGPGHINLSSSNNAEIGLENLLTGQIGFLNGVFNGTPAVSLPIRRSILISGLEPEDTPEKSVMFIAIPIRDNFNQTIAVMVFRLKLRDVFGDILKQGRIGRSGNTFAFNREGILISQSEKELILEKKPSILTVEFRDPGASFFKTNHFNIGDNSTNGFDSKHVGTDYSNEDRPLALLISSALSNVEGTDLTGYRDYRGIPVVAAWIWDDEKNIGVITTMDKAEAYQTFSSNQLIFALLLMLIFLLSMGIAAMVYFNQLRRKTKILAEIEKDKSELYFNAVDSIIVALDCSGLITKINRKGCELLNTNSNEIIGKNWFDCFIPLEQKDQVKRTFYRLIKGEIEPVDYFENDIITGDGVHIPIAWRNSFLLDETGVINGILSAGIDITKRKKAEEELRASDVRFRMLVEGIGQKYLIYRQSLDDRFQYLSPACQHFTGFTKDSAVGQKSSDLFDFSASSVKRIKQYRQKILKVGHTQTYNANYRHPDKSTRYVDITESCEKDNQGRVVAILGIIKDVTKMRNMQQELSRAATVFENTDEGIMIADADANIIMTNHSFAKITGYSLAEVSDKDIFSQLSKLHDSEFIESIKEQLAQSGQWRGQLWNMRKNGDLYPAWQNITLVRDHKKEIVNYVAIFSDITLLKRSEERLAHQAHHDSLTGLPNRLLFIANLEQSLQTAKRHKHRVGLMFIDLDRFKSINDTRGHGVGDKVLQVIAERMKNCVRAEDTVARLGGDEFTILLSEISVSDDVGILAEKIVKAVREPIKLADLSIVVSISLGISIFPDDANDSESLLKAADIAMYQAKALGKDNFHFFTKALAARSMRYAALERDLQNAIDEQQFEVYYQPQIRLKDKKIVGLEALIRWNHPKLGLLLPEEFIHIADDSELIDTITEWVIYTAIRDHDVWSVNGNGGLRIAVNITGRQFVRERSVQKFINVLNKLAPELNKLKLDLEITETAFEQTAQVIKIINKLKQRDVLFSIDDFGTGHSSLSRLKNIPVESVKIDQSFIREITSCSDDKEIVKAIIAMSHSLGLRVLGEGVEQESQYQILQELGCDEIQGFYISHPLPAEEISKYLNEKQQFN